MTGWGAIVRPGGVPDAATALLRRQQPWPGHRRSPVLSASRRDEPPDADRDDRGPHPDRPGVARPEGTALSHRGDRGAAGLRLQRLESPQPARAVLGGAVASIRGSARDHVQAPVVVSPLSPADPDD